MNWTSLTSIQNLTLAWRRITTGRNLQYKRFFRDAYNVYESALADNLRALKAKLDGSVWRPSHAIRIYLPKPSGLQRPLSLLELEDQIVLQAIANQFAFRLRRKRARVEKINVFSNLLTSDRRSIFFTERWQTGYRSFQNKCEVFYDSENCRWVGHFDLAAYYDTISHDLMISTAFPSIDTSVRTFVEDCFQHWSANDIQTMTGHGIPQGPVASDFLADGFFLPIDLFLLSISQTTIRYVDDIRIFGESENEVRETAIKLEQECRHRGLIPQSSKFEVKQLTSIEDAMGSMPSIPPSDPNDQSADAMDADYAYEMLESSLAGRPLKVRDKSRFRYIMYRAPTDNRILNRVLALLPRHPEHIDAFATFFGNYAKRPRIARVALNALRSGVPYSYVRGEMWHLIARLGSKAELHDALSLALVDARRRTECIVLSWGVMHFLLRCEREGIAQIGQRLSAENSLSRSLLGPLIPDREVTSGRVICDMLRGTSLEQMAGARVLQQRTRTLNSIGIRRNSLSELCQNSLRELGVIKRVGSRHRDWIASHLVSLYQCNNKPLWDIFLGTEYEHAKQIVIEASVRFESAYSEWLSLQDSFNDIITRKFIEFIRARNLPGHTQRLVASNGSLIKFGSLIQANAPLDTNHSSIADHLRAIHRRRNQLPGSHPYDERGGTQNWFLRKRERDSLRLRQRSLLNELIQFLVDNSI